VHIVPTLQVAYLWKVSHDWRFGEWRKQTVLSRGRLTANGNAIGRANLRLQILPRSELSTVRKRIAFAWETQLLGTSTR